jgi:hypothetical protein
MENSDSPFSLLVWNYKSVARNVLPTIVLALEQTADANISTGNPERDLFIFHNGFHTLPYDFVSWNPYTDGSSFTTLIIDAWDDFRQNTDYRSCEEIYAAAKSITAAGSNNEYQILDNNWVLLNQQCNCIITWCSAP